MTRSHIAGIPVALGFVILLLAPSELAAKSGGVGIGAHRSIGVHHILGAPRNGFHSQRHRGFRGFRNWPLYGGYIATTPLYRADYDGQAPDDTPILPSEPLHALDCKRTQTTVIVPSGDGGTRQIVVTRC